MLEQLTDIERRQALCRAIFLLDDTRFRYMEQNFAHLQELLIARQTGHSDLCLCFTDDEINVRAIREKAERVKSTFKKNT